MLQKDNPRLKVYLIMQFFFVLLAVAANAQVYYHNFGTSNINSHPYTVAPTTINPNLSGSSWTNSASAWSNQNGATGQAITVQTSGTTTITLSLAVASDFQANITSFNFWNRRSSTGPQNWAMSINGIPVGSGTTSASTSGAAIGVTNVSSPVSGITGTLTVTLTLTGPSGTGGNFRLDDFILNGTVTSTCNAVITSFVPSTGPANTVVTINGSGFTGATAVKFGNIPATAFTVISDTVIEATVPEGAAAGTVGITVNNCSGFSTSSFTPLSSQCGMLGEIFISELYDEGSGQGGMIELYNPTSSPINLDLQDGQPVAYILQRYGDIDDTNPTAGHILQLHGSIAPGATYLVAKIAPNNCTRSISYTISASSNSGFNANDKFELLKNGVLIDVVHVPFQSPGFSIIRKPNAVAPIPVYNNNDWNNSNSESCSDLGRHTINMAPLPVVTQPVSKTICEDGATTFSVAVTPAVGYTYQWKVLNLAGIWVNVANSTNYTGAATNTLSVVDAPAGFNNNQYYCQLTSAMCDIKSNAAQLSVIAPPAVPVATTTSRDCTTPNGTITVSSPTGPELTYSIDNTTFQAGTTFNGVASGNYTLTVKNAPGCTATTTVTVAAAPNAPAAPTVTTLQPDCANPKGTITFTAQQGVSYSIDGTNFQNSAIFNNLDAGTYTPIVKNTAGCIASGTPVTINAAPTVPNTPVAATTQPDCTIPAGTITITSPTGTDFTYSVDGTTFQASPIFNSLSSRNYTVTVKNIAGCTATTTAVINAAPGTPTTPVVTLRQPDCTNPKGTITFTAQQGVSYSIDGTNFQNSAIFSNVDSGTYTPVAKNSAGCIASGTPVTINTAPTVPNTPVVATTQPDCTTPAGSITITSPTGTDFTYSVDGTTFQASPIFNNLASRSYTVTVKNTAGCTAITTTVINAAPGTPTTPVVTLRQPDCTNPKGTITFNTQSGVTYSIDGTTFQNSATFSNVDPGTYTPVVKNSAGCIASGTPVTINAAPTVPGTPVAATTQPDCTTPAGTITVTSPTGTDFTYSVDGTTFQALPIFNNLSSRSYTVTVKNTAGCTATTTAVINAAPGTPTTPVVTLRQPDCTNPKGTITFTAQQGVSYSIDGTNFQNAAAFNNIDPGTYTPVVKNTSGCIASGTSVTINAAPTVPTTPVVATTQPDCTIPAGTITVTSPTGTDFTYSVDGITFQASPIFNNLASRSYTVTVKNTAGCTATTTAVINAAPGTPTTPVVTLRQPDCTNLKGTITFTAQQGVSYSIDGINFQNSAAFNNVDPGTYTPVVKNSAGCIASSTPVTINAAPTVPTTPVVATAQPDCTTPAGTITVTSPTGTDFTYSVDGTTFQASPIFNSLSSRSYTVTVKNTAGCTATTRATIAPAPAIPAVPVLALTQPDCSNNKGAIRVSSPLGTGLTYSIDGFAFQGSATFTNVDSGSHTITVKNAMGCTAVGAPVTINAAPTLPGTPVAATTQPDCTTNTGTITVTSPTGTDFTYSIDGTTFQASPIFANLASRSYTLTVKNTAGCTATTRATITPAPAIPSVPVLALTQPNCSNDKGTIRVSSPLGTGLTYSIDGSAFQASVSFINVDPGNHTITVKNAAGCSAASATVVIDIPPAPAPDPGTITGTTEVCMGETTQLTNTVTGGTWTSSNTAIATVDANGLVKTITSGAVIINYTVGAVCTSSASVTLRVNELPQPSLFDTYYLCVDNVTGAISSKVLNSGLSPALYSFTWKKGNTLLPDTSNTITVNEPGDYTVTATNIATGCSAADTATVSLSSIAIAYAEVGQDFFLNQTITVHVTGGSGDYEYQLEDGPFQDTPYFTGIREGEYSITVRDKHECGITELNVFALNYPRFFTPNGDGSHELWNIKSLREQSNAKIYIFDRYGKVITTIKPAGLGWDGTYNGARLPATDYWFTVEYMSSNGSQKEFKAHFSLLR